MIRIENEIPVVGDNVRVSRIAANFREGETVNELMIHFGLTREQTECAIRFRMATPAMRRRMIAPKSIEVRNGN